MAFRTRENVGRDLIFFFHGKLIGWLWFAIGRTHLSYRLFCTHAMLTCHQRRNVAASYFDQRL